jgi:hypothetical protein
VTLNEQDAVLPLASVAVQVTVVVPTGTIEPDGSTQAKVTPGQLSETVGSGKVTVTVGDPGVPTAVIFAGQVIVGGCVSLTVTVNEHVAIATESSLQVTVVVPTGKNDPDGGLQVIVPQLPLAVGGG